MQTFNFVTTKTMKVLSLFDGISCGRIALERAGIKIDKYFASEIDKYAIQVSKKNWPDIVHIGDIRWVTYYNNELLMWDKEWDNSRDQDFIWKIDLIIGGSPCQDLSIAKSGWKGLQGEKSGLFFEYVRLLKECKPKYFLLENVNSMKKADKDEITRVLMEVYPDTEVHMINSDLVSAQNRKRLYWTNIPWIVQPQDRWIILRDILDEEVEEKYYIDPEVFEKLKAFESNARLSDKEWKVWALSTMQWGHRQPKVQVIWNVHPSGHGMNGMVYDIGGKSPTISTNKWEWSKIVINKKRIRKLTPIECERLQTLPDNYTEWVSNTQRYKGIGNGWTVDVIAHIFSFIKKLETI